MQRFPLTPMSLACSTALIVTACSGGATVDDEVVGATSTASGSLTAGYVSAIDQLGLPVGTETGHFEDNGLDVTLADPFPTGVDAINALEAGEVDIIDHRRARSIPNGEALHVEDDVNHSEHLGGRAALREHHGRSGHMRPPPVNHHFLRRCRIRQVQEDLGGESCLGGAASLALLRRKGQCRFQKIPTRLVPPPLGCADHAHRG